MSESEAFVDVIIELLKPIGIIAVNTFVGGLLGGNVGVAIGGSVGSVAVAASYSNNWNKLVKALLVVIKSLSFFQFMKKLRRYVSDEWQTIIMNVYVLTQTVSMIA